MLYSGESSVLFSYIDPRGWAPTFVSFFFSFMFGAFKEKGLANGCIHYQQKIGVTPYYQSSNLTPASR